MATGSSSDVQMPTTVDELQRKLIADRLGCLPADITPEFLDAYLEQEVYPKVRLTVGAECGGYDNSHLEVLTRAEFEDIRTKADHLFAEALQKVGSR